MRAIALVLIAASAAAAEPSRSVALYWQPSGEPAPAAAARRAFTEGAQALGARVLDVSAPPAAAPSLVPALDAAKRAYAQFQFAAALEKLDELSQLADAQGGADLDARQLSEIFFYRGLCRLEKGADDMAWEDLARAARLDPARTLDQARFPPRAVATYKRAAAEVAQLPHTQLLLEVPDGAVVRVDGAPAEPQTPVTIGAHFVVVTALGYEPFTGVVTVTPARSRFAPPLRPQRPPDGDRLLALAGPQARGKLLCGSLERVAAGWQFVVRDIGLRDGRVVSENAALGGGPVGPLVQGLLDRVVAPPAVVAAAPAPVVRPRRAWWPWLVAGGAVVAVGLALALGVAYGSPAPAVSGQFGSIH